MANDPAGAQAAAAAAIAFSLSPALVNPGQLIDYGTPAGAKIYTAATKPLSEEGAYDLSPENLKTFLASLDDRIVVSGWEAIFSIPEDPAVAPPVLHMMTTDYGVITMAQINTHVQTYIANNDRDCQNSFQAFNCLMASLTDGAKKRINLLREQFTIDGIGNGPLLFKTIIQTAYVDTRSTVLYLRDQLSQLDTYMVDIQSDIEQFNDHVKTLVSGLNARGEQTLDLLANLFKGYMTASDSAFIDFIKRKKDAYEEGEIDLTPNALMQATVNKYNSLKQQGRWNQASEQDEKIIALQAKLESLEVGRKKGDKSPGTQKGPKQSEWVNISPPEGAPEVKVVSGKTYYWCTNHGKWSLNPKHTTSLCKGFGLKSNKGRTTVPAPDTTNTTVTPAAQGNTPALRLASAIAATVNDEEEQE
jgi:hypothetical protein